MTFKNPRKTSLKRTRLNKVGRRGKIWKKVRAEPERKLFLENRIYCLVCGSSDTTPAHVWRRWHSTKEMLEIFAPLCKTDHNRIDALGERFAYPLITYLIECAEYERQPEIDFRIADDKDLRDFANKLMPEEAFYELRRKLCNQ